MHIRVLGSAAGGGFPQWNCGCQNCSGLRNGTIAAQPRTQSSIAVSGDGATWVLFNASPDVAAQLESFPAMQPRESLRGAGFVAIVLMDSQIDHTAGLLVLREGDPLDVYCTDPVYQDLTTEFPIFHVLTHYCGVQWHRLSLEPDLRFSIAGAENLSFTVVPLTSKAPPYSSHRQDPHPGDNIGVRVEDTMTGRNVFYAPGLAEIEPHVQAFLENADCLLVDGTFWSEDELKRAGVGTKSAREIGHLPQSGDDGMIATLHAITRPRKILIHINNTNPILDENSAERATLTNSGIEVAYDGMDIVL